MYRFLSSFRKAKSVQRTSRSREVGYLKAVCKIELADLRGSRMALHNQDLNIERSCPLHSVAKSGYLRFVS